MSTTQMKRVEDYKGELTRSEFQILKYLAGWVRDDKESRFPSIARIAKETRYSERNVCYALRSMKEKGVLATKWRGGGRHHTSSYIILPEQSPQLPPTNGHDPDFTAPLPDPSKMVPLTEQEEKLLFSLRDWQEKVRLKPESEFFKEQLRKAEAKYQQFQEEKMQYVPTK